MGRVEDLKWAIKNEQNSKKDAKIAIRYKIEDNKAYIKKCDYRIKKARRELKKLTKKRK